MTTNERLRAFFCYNDFAMWYFYILQSVTKPDYFYKGSTGNLEKRLIEHNSGKTTSLKSYRPFRIHITDPNAV